MIGLMDGDEVVVGVVSYAPAAVVGAGDLLVRAEDAAVAAGLWGGGEDGGRVAVVLQPSDWAGAGPPRRPARPRPARASAHPAYGDSLAFDALVAQGGRRLRRARCRCGTWWCSW